MAEIGERIIADAPGGAFAERRVNADGFRIRYLEAGQRPPLVRLHGAAGPWLGRAHDLLASRLSDFLERHEQFVVNRTSGLLHR